MFINSNYCKCLTIKFYIKMKKINLSNIKNSLTKNELNKIMAGSGDIINTNSFSGCTCTYNNHSLITNDNSVSDCNCTCKKR